MTTTILLAVTAIYLLVLGCMMDTKNIVSTLLFKVLPILLAFFLGLKCFNVF